MKLFCSFLLLVGGVAAAEMPTIQPAWVLVRQPLKWKSPPRVLHMKSRTAGAEVIIFNPSGAFAAVYCYLIRQEDGSILISRGDSHGVKIGTWTRTDSTISVKSRLVYTDGLPIGKPIPGPESLSQFAISDRSGTRMLVRDGATFKPLVGFNDLEFLAVEVTCDRIFWNGTNVIEGMTSPCISGEKDR